jgi:23S rRNA U2552 (ribose-2'-O)-methylase RlmE/FtsJ
MTFFLLPRTYHVLYKNIDFHDTDHIPETVISQSLSYYLYNIKEKITSKEKQWDVYKKYTNPYEYIHTVVPLKKKPVSKYKPLSRSYFKMIEIMNTFHINYRGPICSFHLAEGPGGFIEALAKNRNCKEDTYIGMTLLDENKNDSNIPAWKKSDLFLKSNPNVFLENGSDQTGNILSLENFEYVIEKYPSKMDLITADGGFDFSIDFNMQECSIGKLLFAQVAYALCLQKYKGKFILKIFDCFMQHTIDILYILSSFYEKVYIMKPQTSRYANSEKYIVCIGFLYDNHAGFYIYLEKCFEKMLESQVNPLRFLNMDISYLFIKKMEEYNAIFGQKQIQNIHYTLSLLETKTKLDKIETLIKINIQKSMDWCNKYNIPYNILNTPTNIFLAAPTVLDSNE